MNWLLTSLCFVFGTILCSGQDNEIVLNNPSFEGIPHKGGDIYDTGIQGWYDCGNITFINETAPDLHPIDAWEVVMPPSEGRTYLGMVIRDNDTWESVSQRLASPIEGGKCYSMNIDLARSDKYISGSRVTNAMENYTQPAILQIWGGTGVCGRQELLGETTTVSNREWRTYEFEFRPEKTVSYFTLEVFYKKPTLIPYNGHLLLDNATSIKQIPCDEEDIPISEAQKPIANAPKRPRIPEKTAPAPITEALVVEDVQSTPIVEESSTGKTEDVIPGLQGKSFRKDQIIRINAIYFEADKSKFLETSLNALDQLYQFMQKNKNVVIEVGGHTATTPTTKYCDDLSSRRAKEVASHLASMGISTKRLYYRGYGKRKPIYPNDKKSMEARKKNQRVEIKILKTDFVESD